MRYEVSIIPMATPNNLFAIINVFDPPALRSQLATLPHWPFLEIQDGQWLIMTPPGVTPTELSDKLEITGGAESATGLVIKIDSYYGRTYQTNLDWIKSKKEVELGS